MHITVPFSIYGFLVSVGGYGGNGTGKLNEGYYLRVPSSNRRAFSNLLVSLLPASLYVHITDTIAGTLEIMPRE